MPSLVGDTWGEFFWRGPLVAVINVGIEPETPLLTDITLTGYRDAIDYLGYYRDFVGSMIDGFGMSDNLSKRIMAERTGKVWGIRINCMGDQARGRPELERVAVPKTHPLFNLEGDDPCCIPDLLDRSWVAKKYGNPKSRADDTQSENPLARLPLLQTSVKHGKWVGLSPWWNDPKLGSILFVDRRGGDLEIDQVRTMCEFIEEEVDNLMTEENATPEGEQGLLELITEEDFEAFLDARS